MVRQDDSYGTHGPTARWDAAPARQPFERTGGFVALGAVLVIASAILGYALGGDSGSGSAAADTGESSALQALLPPEVYGDCSPRDAEDGQVAALDCRSAREGADQLLVSQYPDVAAMQADFQAKYAAKYPAAPCSGFPGGEAAKGRGVTSTWKNGLLACYVNSNEDATLLWTYEDRPVQVVAVRTDANSPQLLAWWKQASSVPLRG